MTESTLKPLITLSLAISLIGNLVLSGAYIFGTESWFLSDRKEKSPSVIDSNTVNVRERNLLGSGENRWAKLRELGCPEVYILNIKTETINAHFDRRMRSIAAVSDPWLLGDEYLASCSEKLHKLASLESERRTALEELWGRPGHEVPVWPWDIAVHRRNHRLLGHSQREAEQRARMQIMRSEADLEQARSISQGIVTVQATRAQREIVEELDRDLRNTMGETDFRKYAFELSLPCITDVWSMEARWGQALSNDKMREVVDILMPEWPSQLLLKVDFGASEISRLQLSRDEEIQERIRETVGDSRYGWYLKMVYCNEFRVPLHLASELSETDVFFEIDEIYNTAIAEADDIVSSNVLDDVKRASLFSELEARTRRLVLGKVRGLHRD